VSAARGRRGAALVCATLLGGLAASATPVRAQAAADATAQAAPTLDRVDALIAEGRTEDARGVLTAWMDAAPGEGTARGGDRGQGRAASRADAQRALWLRALLTVDPAHAAVDYQRLVVEYPGGPFSDRALLRLAQAAEAQGDAARARALLSSLMRDYPTSPRRLEAGKMLAALPANTAAVATAPPPPDKQTPAAGTPLRAQTRAAPSPAAQAPATQAPAAQTSATPTPAARTAPSASPTAAPFGARWTVQLGAFASRERAAGRRDELIAAGVEARVVVVPGSPLLRVRTGRYPSQLEADRVRDRLTGDGLDATVAADADREEPAP
jgi:cell division protein FtsN